MSALLVSPTALLAKDSANVPAEVVQGWRDLAKQTDTYRCVCASLRSDGSENHQTLVISRLDDKYCKSEQLKKNLSKEALQDGAADWKDKIVNVVLYDGEEYFMLERPRGTDSFALARVGREVTLAQVLRVGQSQSTSACHFDLLDVLQSQSEEFTQFERNDAGVFVTFTTPSQVETGVGTIVAKLDPLNHYRVISAVEQFQLMSNVRTIWDYEYGDHPAIASRCIFNREQLKADQWQRDGGLYPMTTHWRTIKDVPKSSSEFSLEYYGLSPFRKRYRSVWPMIAIGIGVLVAVSGAIYVWRRRYATA